MFAICAPVLGMILSYTQTYHARYRTTVVVQTPEGVASGSAVRKVTFGAGFNVIGWLLASHYIWEETGQAVVVDMPKGQSLFLLATDPSEDGITVQDGQKMQGGRWQLWPNPPISHVRRKPYPLPLMVRFRDTKDPASVEKVDPNNLAASFGRGYVLQSITQEVAWPWTPITTGIEKKLECLPYIGQVDIPQVIDFDQKPPFSKSVHPSMFKMEDKK